MISLSIRVRLSVEKSWFMAMPFDEFPICVIVLLLIVSVPVVVVPELMTAIPLSLLPVIVLSVASRVKVFVGVARTRPEPPLLDMVFVVAVTARVVKLPEVCR